jgi:hypothetical protein
MLKKDEFMKNIHSSRMSLKEWVSFFVEFIVPDDLSGEVVESFLMHLSDLEALVQVDENIWQWKDCDSQIQCKSLIEVVQKHLESLCDSESGFALAYFIGFKNVAKIPLDAQPLSKDSLKKGLNQKHPGSKIVKPASDLSNLQIVKKVGKQLQPFLQIEASIVSRLVGKHVSKQDAQKLFHYMFGQMNTRAEPKAWEQLSRKRHR